MNISDKIYIDLTTEKVDAEALAKLLTYDNPDYFQKQNLGLSVYGIPKVINTYKLMNQVLEIPRGEALRIKHLIGHLGYYLNHPYHPIKLQYINNDFELDEFQNGAVEAIKGKHQGIVHAVTSAGKSLIILKSIVELGQKALIVVNRKVLMEQFLKDIKKYIRDENGKEITPGIIGNGSKTYGDITIAIDKSLAKTLEQDKEKFGTVILDECHLTPANTIFSIIHNINAKFRFGFSGTLKRKDQKEFLMFAIFGSVIYKIGKEDLLAKGRVVPVVPVVWESDTQFNWNDVVTGMEEQGVKNAQVKARALQNKTIAFDQSRNNMILRKLVGLKGKTIVLSNYVEPCYTLQDELRKQYGVESMVITGKSGKEATESYNAMKEGNLQIIFATVGCVSTGVSISDLDNIVLISPIFTNELLLHQIRGRLMRTFEGKTHGTLYFVYDQYIFEPYKLSRFLKIIRN